MKTRSEELFEFFLSRNRLPFKKIEESDSPRPDYLVDIGAYGIAFEVKELASEAIFDRPVSSTCQRSFSATLGDHVRARVDGSRKQVQYGASLGIPSVLLIYNNADPLQMIGTSDQDFLTAMYGEYTIFLDRATEKSSDIFHGRNQSLQARKNTSFSAVGRIRDTAREMEVVLFENVFAKVALPWENLPTCFDVHRVQVVEEPPSFK